MDYSPDDLSEYLRLTRADMAIPPPQSDRWRYHVPMVWLADHPAGGPSPVLCWRHDHRECPRVHPSAPVLQRFMRLADVPERDFPSRVLAFAQEFGPLGICRHGKLPGHSGTWCPPLEGGIRFPGFPTWEPLEAWRRYSRQLLGVLRIVVDLQEGESGSADDWQAIEQGDPQTPPVPLEFEHDPHEWALSRRDFSSSAPDAPIVSQRVSVAHAVSVWLRYGGVQPRVEWLPGESQATIHMEFLDLPGLLAVQLASAVSRRSYICSGCGYPFTVPEERRQPPVGRRKWCPDCGRKAQWKDYQKRRYQQRKSTEGGTSQ